MIKPKWEHVGLREWRRTNKAGTGVVWPCGLSNPSLPAATVWAWAVSVRGEVTVGTAYSCDGAQGQADQVLRKAARKHSERVLPPDMEYTG